MKEALRILGGILLVAAGTGCGAAIYGRKHRQWQQLHTFARLMAYLGELLSYQPLSGRELLGRAARYPAFARLGVAKCCELAALPLPECLPLAVQLEVRQGLEQIALEPRTNACTTLRHLESLCEEAAAARWEEAQAARSICAITPSTPMKRNSGKDFLRSSTGTASGLRAFGAEAAFPV